MHIHNQEELVNFAVSYNPSVVFLVHGEKEKKQSLSKALKESNINQVLTPENGEKIDIGLLLALKDKVTVEKSPK